MVVVVEHNHLANDLNNKVNQVGLTNFLHTKLDEELRVFAITSEESNELIELFKKKALSDTLPKEIQIDLAVDTKEVVSDSLINKAEMIFGKDGFTVEE